MSMIKEFAVNFGQADSIVMEDLVVEGNLGINGGLFVSGGLEGSLYVTVANTNAIYVTGNTNLMTTDPLIVTGSVYISNPALAVTISNVSPITVVGSTNLVTTDPLTVTGSVYISNSLISVAVTNPVAVTGSVAISNSNPLAVTGSVYISNSLLSVAVTNPLAVTGSVAISNLNPLAVTGSVFISNSSLSVAVTNPLAVTGSVAISNPLSVTGSVYISNSLISVAVTNPLAVTGSVAISNPLSVTGSVFISNSLISVAVTNPLAVTGSVSISNISPIGVTGSLNVTVNNAVSIPVSPASYVSTANSTTTGSFGAGTTITGAYEDVSAYATLSVLVNCSQTTTLDIDYSTNGSTQQYTTQFIINANQGSPHLSTIIAKYFRTRVTNTSGSVATLALQTILHTTKAALQTVSLTSDTLSSDPSATLVRNVNVGQNPNGRYKNVLCDAQGSLQVNIASPQSAFGEILTVQPTPCIQMEFVYGINLDTVTTFTILGASITSAQNSGCVDLLAAGTTGSQAVVKSTRLIAYRPGQGSDNKFTAAFISGGVTGSTQIAGPFTPGNGFAVGYNGADFGFLRRYAGLQGVYSVNITGAAVGAGNAYVQLNGSTVVVPFIAGSITSLASQLSITNFYITADTFGWQCTSSGSTLTFLDRAANLTTGTFSITGTSGFAAGGSIVTPGAVPTEQWIKQTEWNVDVMDGTGSSNNPSGVLLDPKKGNIYDIVYQYLGFGQMQLRIVDPNTGLFTIVNNVKYSNLNVFPNVRNPNFPGTYYVSSTSNTSPVLLRGVSYYGNVQGIIRRLGPKYSSIGTKAINSSALFNVVTIRNNITNYNVANYSEIFISFTNIAGFNMGNNTYMTFTLLRNAQLADTNFQLVNSSSFVSFDTNGTLITGGIAIFSFLITNTGSNQVIDMTPLDVVVVPGETLTLAASSNDTSSNAVGGFSWIENT